MATPDARRSAVTHLCAGHGVSQRRACAVLAIDRSSVPYRSLRPDDADVREAMRQVAEERRRFGNRRIYLMLQRQGIRTNQKKLRRLYAEERLQVRKRGGRKRALGTRRPMVLPGRTNERWSLDFVSDAFTDGRRFRVLAVVGDYSRECLALVADTSLSGLRVTRELDALIRLRGKPVTVHCGLGQRSRAHQYGRSQMVSGDRCRLALHPARQADAKRFRRGLQR